MKEVFFCNVRTRVEEDVTYPYYRMDECPGDYETTTVWEKVYKAQTLRVVRVEGIIGSTVRYEIDARTTTHEAYSNLDKILGRGEYVCDSQEFATAYMEALNHLNDLALK